MTSNRKITSQPGRGKSKQKPAKKKILPAKQKATSAVKLSFSETFFRALIEHSSTASTLLNREGNVIYDSPAASGMLGYSPTEWIGKSVFDLIHPEDQQNIQNIFQELLKKKGSQVNASFRLHHKDHSWILVEAVATNLLAEANVQAIVVNYSDVTERKQAEAQIAYQADLLKHINDAVLAVNSQFQITAWNDAAEKMYGWSADEVIGRLSTDILPSNMTPEQREEVFKHLQEFGSYRIELVHYRKDGQPVHVEANTIALYDKDKHVTGLLSVNRDITERKQAEEALATSEAELRALFVSMQDAVMVIDRNGVYRKIAPTNPDLLYKPSYEMLGKNLWDIFPAEQADTFNSTIQEVLKTRQTAQIEYALPIGNQLTWFAASISSIDAENTLWIARDITDRKQAEKALTDSETHLRTIVQSQPECVKLLGLNGALQDMNPAGLEMIEADSLEQVMGTPIQNIVVPEYRAAFKALNARVFKGESGTLAFEIIGLKGTRRWLETHAVPLRNEEGKIISLLGLTRDITERKRVEQALRENQQRLQLFFDQSLDGFFFSMLDEPQEWNDSVNKEAVIEYVLTHQHITEVNDAMLLQYGATRQNFIGRTPLELFAHDVNQARRFRRRLFDAGHLHLDTEERREDGMPIWIEGDYVTIRDEQNRIKGIFGIQRDITDRKQTEDALRESEARFRAFVTTSSDVVYRMSPDWSEMRQLDGRGFIVDTDKPTARWLQEYIHPDDQSHVMAVIHEAIRTKGVFELEHRVRRVDGTFGWTFSRAIPLYDANGEIIEWFGAAVDVTARKQIEQALRDSEEQYRKLFEDSPISLWLEDFSEVKKRLDILRASGVDDIPAYIKKHPEFVNDCASLVQVLDVNTATLELYGANDKAELIGSPADNLASISLDQIEYGLIQLAKGKLNFEREGIDQTFAGEKIYVHIYWSVVPGFEDSLERVIVSTVDVTERKRAEQRNHHQVQRLNALRSIDIAISNTFDLKLSLRVLLNGAISQLDVDAVAILLFNPAIATLEYAAGEGFDFSAIQESKLKLGEGLAGQAALERRIIHTNQLAHPDSGFLGTKILDEEGFVSYYALPLISKGELKGVLEIFHREELHPDKEWLDFLETLAGQAAIAIDNSQLFEGLQRSNLELNSAYDATIEGWSAALDLRDKETEGHSQRVTELTVKLAQRMGIPDSGLLQIRRGALLHDIGKLGIPDYILLKPDKLTKEEWEIMQKHPVYAYEMLSPISYLKYALDIPYCHHEKWDGTGYPRQLKGAAIPLAARIFAIVDVWDALNADRPYRLAWTRERSFEHIKEQAGIHFDPQVVEAFFKMMNNE